MNLRLAAQVPRWRAGDVRTFTTFSSGTELRILAGAHSPCRQTCSPFARDRRSMPNRACHPRLLTIQLAQVDYAALRRAQRIFLARNGAGCACFLWRCLRARCVRRGDAASDTSYHTRAREWSGVSVEEAVGQRDACQLAECLEDMTEIELRRSNPLQLYITVLHIFQI